MAQQDVVGAEGWRDGIAVELAAGISEEEVVAAGVRGVANSGDPAAFDEALDEVACG
ncbi:hypothetical protein [Leifsonia sp. Root112D2]|uniref:hypothetical protein n=1 Tax=Leifsonia sp. Root112D2 TaxID=1736426 RepID=UPI001F1848BF|nr:hypothetical protein [Leifsonia sp. Root112D2]